MTSQTSLSEDEISLSELMSKARAFGRLVWSERRIVLRVALLSGALGLFTAFGSGQEFTASTRLLPYRGGTGGATGLSGLAGLAGIRLSPGAGDQTIAVDLYPEVASGQDFRKIVAETPLQFRSLPKKVTAVEYFRDVYETPVTKIFASYTLGLPGRLIDLFRPEPTKGIESTAQFDTTTALTVYDPEYLGLVNTLAGRVTVSVEKKAPIITITGMMPDPYAAADLVRVTSDRLMERIVDVESRKAKEQFQFIDRQHQQAKSRFERAQRELAIFADRNRALMSATSKIDQERLQREYDLSFELYQQFSRELEQARIKMNQDIPVFTVLEPVIVPNYKSSPRRGRIILVSIALGLIGGVGLVAGRKVFSEA